MLVGFICKVAGVGLQENSDFWLAARRLLRVFSTAAYLIWSCNSMICVEVFVFKRLQSSSACYYLLPKQVQ